MFVAPAGNFPKENQGISAENANTGRVQLQEGSAQGSVSPFLAIFGS